MIIGTAGHVDHGKTALVHALTGVDTDRLKEEKERGITIDLGFAYLPAPDGAILGFVDVPGHEKFVHNMLAGAGGIDFVLLVVAADDGVMPQTREHLAIVDLLGVDRGIVALTKIDLVSAERREAVAAEIAKSLEGTGLAGSRNRARLINQRRGHRHTPGAAVCGGAITRAACRERPLPPGSRSFVHADRRRHGGHRHCIVGGGQRRRSRQGQPIRDCRARSFDSRSESSGRSWPGRGAVRAQSCRRRYCQRRSAPRRCGARSRASRPDRPDRRFAARAPLRVKADHAMDAGAIASRCR